MNPQQQQLLVYGFSGWAGAVTSFAYVYFITPTDHKVTKEETLLIVLLSLVLFLLFATILSLNGLLRGRTPAEEAANEHDSDVENSDSDSDDDAEDSDSETIEPNSDESESESESKSNFDPDESEEPDAASEASETSHTSEQSKGPGAGEDSETKNDVDHGNGEPAQTTDTNTNTNTNNATNLIHSSPVIIGTPQLSTTTGQSPPELNIASI